MQLSLRSQMMAGIAALGVSAIAVAPVVQPELLPAAERMSSAVDLTSFYNPLTSLIYTGYWAIGDSILSQAELLDPEDLYWPDSFYTSDFSFLFAPGYAGAIPDFVNQFSFGGLSAVISNLSGYGNAATFALASLIDGPTTAIWNTPFALITAAGYLLAGEIDLALAELQTQIIDPLVTTVTDTLRVAGYIVDNAIANVGTIIGNTIPGLLANTIGTLVNGTAYVVESAIATLGTAVSDLLAGQFEDAWNGAVTGLLGPDGTLGQITDLTIGIGITEFVDYEDVGEVLTVVIPSLRSDLTSAGQRLGDYNYYGEGGIRNDWFDPFPEEAESAAAVTETAPTEAAPTEAAPVEVDARAEVAATEASASAADSADLARPVAGDQADEAVAAAPAAETAAADAATPATPAAEAAEADKPAAPAKGKGKASRGSAKAAS